MNVRLIAASRVLCWLMAGVTCCAGVARADDRDNVEAAQRLFASRVADADKASQSAFAGQQGWFYFVPELRALTVGPFWGDSALKVSRSAKPEYADPLPAILDFQSQLKKAGVELLVVPVPAKAAVYPEWASATPKDLLSAAPPRIDVSDRQFYEILKQQGVTVVDLWPQFVEHRNDPEGAVYCKTDSHWSCHGVVLAAKAIQEIVKDREWLRDLPRTALLSESRTIQFSGDLARIVDEQNPAKETISLTFVGSGATLTPVSPVRESPVLLIGDSHTLIFHDPTLVAQGAGLPDHLALNLGTPVDLVGVRGSGATTTRIELLRRKDNLAGKKLVIWCFSFREFTESSTGWRSIPVIR